MGKILACRDSSCNRCQLWKEAVCSQVRFPELAEHIQPKCCCFAPTLCVGFAQNVLNRYCASFLNTKFIRANLARMEGTLEETGLEMLHVSSSSRFCFLHDNSPHTSLGLIVEDKTGTHTLFLGRAIMINSWTFVFAKVFGYGGHLTWAWHRSLNEEKRVCSFFLWGTERRKDKSTCLFE